MSSRIPGVGLLLVGMMWQMAAGAEVKEFHLTLESQWMWGPVRGYLQSPSAGQSGTSTRRRPSLEELGIDTASILDAEIRPGVGDHELYFGGQWIRFSEDATLEDDLISQGNTFLAGSRVSSDIKLDWYRAGYRYRIQRGDEPGVELPFEIHSRVGVAVLDFHYELDGAGPGDVDKDYIRLAPQSGVEMEWHATRRFSILGEFTSTLPFKNLPWILTAEVVGRFTVLEKGKMGLSGYVGGGYEHISYHDSEEVRNHISADFGPMVILGVELRF